MGSSLKHLINRLERRSEREIGFKVLSGQGAEIDTGTASGKLILGLFSSLAEFERGLIRGRTYAGLAAARARGKKGGWKFQLSKHQVQMAQLSTEDLSTNVSALCRELGVSRQKLYSPQWQIKLIGVIIN